MRRYVFAVLLVLLDLVSLALAVGAGYSVEPHVMALPALYCVAFFARIVYSWLHELGHIVAAVAVRLRVAEVSIHARASTRRFRVGQTIVRFGLYGPISRVKVWQAPSRAARPAGGPGLPKWSGIAFALGGPLANLLVAGVLYALRGRWIGLFPGAKQPADALVTVTIVTGVAMGVVNLVPLRVRRGAGGSSDGRQIWHHLLGRPVQGPVDLPLFAPSVLAEVQQPVRSPAGDAQLRQVRARVDAGGPDPVDAAVALLSHAVDHDLEADAWRLLALARWPEMPAVPASFVAGWIANARCVRLLLESSRSGLPVPHDRVSPAVEAAEVSCARGPYRMQARTSLALTWLLLDRPSDTRALLADLGPDGTVREQVNLWAIRAMAEMELGDLVEARRHIDTANRVESTYAVLTHADGLLLGFARRMLVERELKGKAAEPVA
jgi:hypothetical protein